MKVIQESSTLFCKVAGKQPQFTGKGRMFKYVIQQPVDDGILFFNTLSCELIHLTKEECSQPTLNSQLSALNYFVVPEDFDDKLFVQEIRPIVSFMKHKEGVNSYTILTTTDCNARCFYCYEKGRSRIPMSQETAKKVSEYIIHNYQDSKTKTQNPKPVHIGWFGGEPLYNLKVIDSICTDLKNAEVPYNSSMISNGYLITPEVVDKAKSLWKLNKVQITLDGTEEVYNKAKSFYRIKDSAYKRVLSNIQLLLDAEITVSVRMNLDLHNADNLMLLADELKEKFGGNKYFSAYSHVLFENCDHVSTADERPQVNALNDRLMDKLKEAGMRNIQSLPTDIAINCCMSDNEQSVMIAPTGELGKCEHYTDSDFFSHIDHPEEKDNAMIQKFAEKREEAPLCNDCPFYPQCIRLKICVDYSACDEYERNQNIKDVQEQMVYAYNKYLEKRKKNEDSKKEYHIFPLLGKFVAVGKDENNNVMPNIITLNEIGKDIFELFITGKTNEEIVAALLEEYDATEQQMSEIVKDFTEDLAKKTEI